MGFYSERLRDIRISYGYTVEYLATQLGISKQAVSKYENGHSIPSEDVLNKIIALFSLPTGYLAKPEILFAQQSSIFYRRQKKTSVREVEEAKVFLKWYYEIVFNVKNFLPLPTSKLPIFNKNLSIEGKAQALRNLWNLGKKPINDLSATLEEQGFYIFTLPLDGVQVDGYSQLLGDYALIVLNQNKGSQERKNFSLAHELGHLILHAEEDFDGSEQKEREADEFAACFLMPTESFSKDILRANPETFMALGEKWRVSPHAAVERGYKLGLLGRNEEENRAHRDSILKRLNKRKNYYSPEVVDTCSIKADLEKIDADDHMREAFLQNLCLPIREIQKLCQHPTIFQNAQEKLENASELVGVQLSFDF